MSLPIRKIAIVHDFLTAFGGAERVLQSLVRLYPDAPVYTLLASDSVTKEYFPESDIRTSFLQKFPKWLRKRHRFLLPLYPAAIESLDLREFDVVITSSGAWSKGVVTRLHTKHIAYIHSPMRYVWDENERYLSSLHLPFGFRFLGRILLSYLRIWDRQAALRPDVLIANSSYTADRIQKYYRLESEVAYPPLQKRDEIVGRDVSKKEYFFVVSRLTEAKRIDVIIESFNKLALPLVIVGTGPDEKRLRKLSGKTIRFLGWQSDQSLGKIFSGARALVHVAEEDFGLSIAEALSYGVPVIAYGHGGAHEIVLPGETGELFFAQTPEILSDGVRRFLKQEGSYDVSRMQLSTQRFSEEIFHQKIRDFVG